MTAALLVVATAWAGRSAVRTRVAARRASLLRARPRAARPPRPRGLTAPPALAQRLRAAAPGCDVDRAWTAWAAASTTGAAMGLVLGGPTLAVLVLAVAVGGPVAAERVWRRRAAARAAAEVPAAVEAVARAMRSGASLGAAIKEASAVAGPAVGAAFTDVAAATARGEPLVDALDRRRADDGGVPGLGLALTAMTVAAETGGPQAAALDGVATTLRQRLAAQAEASALGAQARASAYVIGLAPVAFAVLSAAADHRNADFLLRTPAGAMVLVAGLALDAVGLAWMARLTRIGGPP